MSVRPLARGCFVVHRAPLFIDRSLAASLSRLGGGEQPTVVLPSSLAPDDDLATSIASLFRSGAAPDVQVVAPGGGPAGLRGLLGASVGTWQSIDVRALDPSCELRRVTLPARLVNAGAIVVACDLDIVAERGPYVLDVAASYVSPATRLRLYTSRGRVAGAAEIDLGLRLSGAILALTIHGERWYVATPDPIAGELAALALSERARGAGSTRSLAGPWEDPLVQRATELHLGVLLPAGLELVSPPSDDATIGTAIARHLALRLGIG